MACLVAATAAFAVRHDRTFVILVCCGFVTAGGLLGTVADSAARNTPLGTFFDQHVQPHEHQLLVGVEGRLRADAVRSPTGLTLNLRIERVILDGKSHAATGGALIGVGGELTGDQIPQWRAGRSVAFPAALRRPTTYRNPGVPDTARLLAWRGTALVGSVKSDRLVEVAGNGNAVSETAASARAAIRRAIARTVTPWSQRSGAVAAAILIGDRAGLAEDVERRLQEAGTYHVIAISGGNVAVLAGLCVFVLRVCRLRSGATSFFVVLMLSAYALVVEGGPSVGRATLMAAIYFAALMWDHRAMPANVLALSAVVLFCVDPLQIADAGFALTFGATIGIVAGMAALGHVMPASWWLRGPAALLAASACAEAVLLPIGAFVFSRVTFAGLIVNFAAVPLMTIVQIAGTAAVAAVWWAPDAARWLGGLAHLAVEGLVGSARLIDVAPWLARRLAPPSPWTIAVYYLCMATVIAPRAGRAVRRVAALGAIGCAAWIVTAPVVRLLPRTTPLRVTFLDVGQGDAGIVQFPNGRTLSIDAGGLPAATTFDIAERVISPALWAIGVRRLDYMSITHSDVDHIGGAAGLFRDFRPFEVWEGVPVPPHRPTRELRRLADAAGSVWRTLQVADRASFGDVEVAVRHPPIPEWERQRVRNDDSEVIEIRYGGVSFVFTGDISSDVERRLAPSFARAEIRILKVPHHGSATSSSRQFLDALRPDVAVISAGRGNPFGHPVASVLERYRNVGAAIYRTDHDGAITMETDGATVRVATFTGRRLTLTTHGR